LRRQALLPLGCYQAPQQQQEGLGKVTVA
jgi:hypothetical protein